MLFFLLELVSYDKLSVWLKGTRDFLCFITKTSETFWEILYIF